MTSVHKNLLTALLFLINCHIVHTALLDILMQLWQHPLLFPDEMHSSEELDVIESHKI